MSTPTITRPGLEPAYCYPVIEAQTIVHFLESAVTGVMPNFKRTGLALLSHQERIENFNQNYSQWAQGSHQRLSGSPNSRIMEILASNEYSRFSSTTAMFHLIKSKVWEGISLVSYERWSSKRLDNQERINAAIAYIRLPISLFHYFHKPNVHGFMRNAYNRIYDELELFQRAIDVSRAGKGQISLRMTLLWSQFIKTHFEVMTQVARFWIFTRLAALREVWKGRIYDVFLSGRPLNSTQRTVRVDHLALNIYQELVDLGVETDKAVRFSVVGFKGLTLESESNLSHDELIDMHMNKEKQLRIQYNSRLNELRFSETAARRSREQLPLPEFAEEIQLLFDRERAHIRLQPQVNINAFLPLPDPWITHLKNRPRGQFSFVAYRLSYKESDQEWKAFVAKMDAILDIWSGIAGSEEIKKNASLQWIDGREESIVEGDLQGVRRHFKTLASNDRILPGMHESVCLAVDAACVKSFDFKSDSHAIRSGQMADFVGYVIAVDSNYEGEAPSKSAPPRYDGHVKVLHKLIMTDLYPMLYRQCRILEVIWQIANEHPWQVYVGPIVETEREEWRKIKQQSADILGNLVLLFSRQNLLSDSIM